MYVFLLITTAIPCIAQTSITLGGRLGLATRIHLMDSITMNDNTIKGALDLGPISISASYRSIAQLFERTTDCHCDDQHLSYHEFSRIGIGYVNSSLRAEVQGGTAKNLVAISALGVPEFTRTFGFGASIDFKKPFFWLQSDALITHTLAQELLSGRLEIYPVRGELPNSAIVFSLFGDYTSTLSWGEQMSTGLGVGIYGTCSILLHVGYTQNRYQGMTTPLEGVTVQCTIDFDSLRKAKKQ